MTEKDANPNIGIAINGLWRNVAYLSSIVNKQLRDLRDSFCYEKWTNFACQVLIIYCLLHATEK